MAIDFNTGANSLFPRIGRIGKALFLLNPTQASLNTLADDLLGRYPTADEDLTGSLAVARAGLLKAVPASFLGSLRGLATSTLLRMVRADQPTRAGTLSVAMTELVRQMTAGSVSVKRSTVAATPTAFSGNVGTGQVVVATVRGDGLNLENLIAETATIQCVTGGTALGAEQFQYTGTPAGVATVGDWNWPLGSAASARATTASALTSFPGGTNLLVNSSFDAWTGAAVNFWTMSGTFTKETSLVYRSGGNAIRAAAGATPTLTQKFNDGTLGTAAQPTVLTSLAFALWVRGSANLSGGVLRVELVDGSGTAVNDATGSPARADIALTGLTTTYTAASGILRTPLTFPATGLFLRVNVQTTPAGGDLIADHLAMQPLTASYAGGPGWAVFAGSADWRTGDGWSLATTNDRGGASSLATFQTLFDRLYGTRSLGLLLPSAASPTIADTLITS